MQRPEVALSLRAVDVKTVKFIEVPAHKQTVEETLWVSGAVRRFDCARQPAESALNLREMRKGRGLKYRTLSLEASQRRASGRRKEQRAMEPYMPLG